jgi:hypothetical protein
MKSQKVLVLAAWLAIGFLTSVGRAEDPSPQRVISLAGSWRFALDPNKDGIPKGFFQQQLPQQIHLPGSTDEAKFGTLNASKPSLDGLYRLYSYEGPAWYQRDIEIPAAWQGKRVSLFLERVHWETRVWVDGRHLGKQDSLIAPHVHDLGVALSPGKHRLTICVDNTLKFDLGRFVSISYEGTQTNWNGIIGRIELRAADPVAIDDVQVYPDVDHKRAEVRVVLTNVTDKPARGTLTVSATERQSGRKVPPQTVDFAAGDARTTAKVDLPMGENAQLWDEFSPALYDLTVSLAAKQGTQAMADERCVTFGMRKIGTKGTQLTLNDRPIFLRGTLECGIFPLTGYPPTDVAAWRRIYRIIQSYGLNHLRFHSWCPPEAAFTGADEEGVILQVEGPQANVPTGKEPQRDAFVEQELLRIVAAYGNHPSFCLMTLGNEYGGSDEVLTRWVGNCRQQDPRHLYSSASNNHQRTANRQFTVGPWRGIKGPGTDSDLRDAIAREDRPTISHEIAQWTFYPNFDEIKKYTGVLAAKNFELVRDDLAAKHLLDLAPQFVAATGRHAVLLYKEEIEVLLRTPQHGGFALLDLHDYPGQGTALVGLLDPFWDSKGLIAPDAHRRYCGATVPLVRMKKRTFTADETFRAEVEVAHFGPKDLTAVRPQWSIKDTQGHEIAAGEVATQNVPTGTLTTLGSLEAPLAKAAAPCKLTVAVSLKGTDFSNDWEIWVYPPSAPLAAPANVTLSTLWDDATKMALAEGKKVLLLPQPRNPQQTLAGKFLPVFWSPVWFPTQRPNAMGILCDPQHPALAQFPTEFFSNWQWYELLQNSRSVILDDAPATFRPIVQVIDNFARNHKLGNLLEARVGKGQLLICTIDLPKLAAKEPAARQLLKSLYDYVGSDAFQPSRELGEELLDKLFAPTTSGTMYNLGASVAYADSEQKNYEAANVLDGDPGTIWHTPWNEPACDFPHQLVIELAKPVSIEGCKLLPRQDVRNGRIKAYEIYTSGDGKDWGQPVAKSECANTAQMQTIRFGRKVMAKFVKLVALSGFEKKPYLTLAEFEVIVAP